MAHTIKERPRLMSPAENTPSTADEDLLDDWLGSPRRLAYLRVVHRDGAPAQEMLSLLLYDLGEKVPAKGALLGGGGQKDQSGSIFSQSRQVDSAVLANLGQKFVRDLYQDPGAVARFGICAGRSAVGHSLKNLQALSDDRILLSELS